MVAISSKGITEKVMIAPIIRPINPRPKIVKEVVASKEIKLICVWLLLRRLGGLSGNLVPQFTQKIALLELMNSQFQQSRYMANSIPQRTQNSEFPTLLNPQSSHIEFEFEVIAFVAVCSYHLGLIGSMIHLSSAEHFCALRR
tara:strand:- start:121 stop:549 length:429 start_codon:yes stop_codon:yes gene_type:complete